VEELEECERAERVIKEEECCGAEREGDGREWVGLLFEEAGGDETAEAEGGEEPECHPY